MKKRVLIWLFILTNIGISEEIINSKNEKENNKIVVEEAVIKQNENEDKKYYGTRITIKYENEFQDFTCGGRDLVLKAKELIKYIDVYTFN